MPVGTIEKSKMKKQIYYVTPAYLLLILFGVITVACGTRKTQKSRAEISTAIKDTAHTKLNTGSTEIKATSIKTYELANAIWSETAGTLTPRNPDIPMSVTTSEGKTTTYNNAIVQFGTKSGAGSTQKEEEVNKVSVKKDTTADESASGHAENIKSEITAGNTDREGVLVNLKFWIAGTVALSIIISLVWFYFWKKKKDNEQNTA